MNNQFLKIPLDRLSEYQDVIPIEGIVYAYIRGFEHSSSFTTGENTTVPIGICIENERKIGERLGLTESQIKQTLQHLQYRHYKGARIWVDIDHKGIDKYWCSVETIEKLLAHRLIFEKDMGKVEKLMSGKN